MRSREPPRRIHATTAAISDGSNADAMGNRHADCAAFRSATAFAITSTRAVRQRRRVEPSRACADREAVRLEQPNEWTIPAGRRVKVVMCLVDRDDGSASPSRRTAAREGAVRTSCRRSAERASRSATRAIRTHVQATAASVRIKPFRSGTAAAAPRESARSRIAAPF